MLRRSNRPRPLLSLLPPQQHLLSPMLPLHPAVLPCPESMRLATGGKLNLCFLRMNCPAILLLKPKYRSAICSGQSTRATITNAEYTGTQREADERWIQQFQAQESNYKPIKNITVAGYPINSFVGYKVGNSGRFFDGDGFCYKVFFEFRDATADLTPELYMQFASALSDAGFVGDSKIGMQPGYARFNYNNVIVHTGSPEMGKIAEGVGLKIFGSKLAHYARGLDVLQNQQDGRFSDPQDWHHFLGSATDLSRLSSKASFYVNFSD